MDESKTGQSISVSTTPAEPTSAPVQQPTVGVSVGREQGPVATVPATEIMQPVGEHQEIPMSNEVRAVGVQENNPVRDLTLKATGTAMQPAGDIIPHPTAPTGIINMSLPQAEAQLKTVSDTGSPLRYKLIAGIRQIKRRILRPAA